MEWKESYDDKTTIGDLDKFGNYYCRGSRVTWAGKSDSRPKLITGTVIGFIKGVSFTDTIIKTDHNQIVRHANNQLVVISKFEDELNYILNHAAVVLYNRKDKSIFNCFKHYIDTDDIDYIKKHWND